MEQVGVQEQEEEEEADSRLEDEKILGIWESFGTNRSWVSVAVDEC